MLLFGHRQLEAVGKRFFVLADECRQTLKQMKVSATMATLHGVISSLIAVMLFEIHDPPVTGGDPHIP